MRRPWDPAETATGVGALLVVAGFAVICLAWRGLAATLEVPLQAPYAVSGGVAGLALIGAGAAIVDIQAGRRERARERSALQKLVSAAADVLAGLPRPSAQPADTTGEEARAVSGRAGSRRPPSRG